MGKNSSCYGDSLYRVHLRRKSDFTCPIADASEFYYSMRCQCLSSDNELVILITGLELSTMIENLGSHPSLYVHSIEYVNEICVFFIPK